MGHDGQSEDQDMHPGGSELTIEYANVASADVSSSASGGQYALGLPRSQD